MTNLRDGDLLSTLQQIESYTPHETPVRPASDRCYTKSKMPGIYRKAMLGKGVMTTQEVAAAIGRLRIPRKPSRTKCAVNSCIRYQLVPMGMVRTTPAKPGRGNEAMHEWIGG